MISRPVTSKMPLLGPLLHRGLGVLWPAWQLLRLPVFGLLLILEPTVRFALSWLALLSILTAFVFESSGDASRFPFWGMIGFSGGCAVVLLIYHALLRALK